MGKGEYPEMGISRHPEEYTQKGTPNTLSPIPQNT